MLTPEARGAALGAYLGILVVFFLLVGGAFLYWVASDRTIDRSAPQEGAIGTVGDYAPDSSPGGFNPAPRPDSTREELEYRGTGADLTRVRQLWELGTEAEGRSVQLDSVNVESARGQTLWVHDGDARAMVIVPDGTAPVHAGNSVDVSGTVEVVGADARVQATRVIVKER